MTICQALAEALTMDPVERLARTLAKVMAGDETKWRAYEWQAYQELRRREVERSK